MKGAHSIFGPAHARRIQTKIGELAQRFDVRVYQLFNNGNHLHLLIRAKTRKGFQDFTRAVACRVAQLVTGAKKGNAFGRFWNALVFSRVVNWGRDFLQTRYYVLCNELEAEGWVDHDRPGRRRCSGTGGSPAPDPFPPNFRTRMPA